MEIQNNNTVSAPNLIKKMGYRKVMAVPIVSSMEN